MKELIEWLKSPENVAALSAVFVAFAAALRVLGELLIAIGKMKKDNPEDWFDRVGAKLCSAAEKLGKFLAWLGIGNKKK